jgi:hypothetical protein
MTVPVVYYMVNPRGASIEPAKSHDEEAAGRIAEGQDKEAQPALVFQAEPHVVAAQHHYNDLGGDCVHR